MLRDSSPVPYGQNNFYFQMDRIMDSALDSESEILHDCTMDRKVEDELEDMYGQLAQKEHDLVLAAELGKALLEENNHLLSKQADINLEFQQHREVFEQEKHELRRQLEQLQTEFDNRLLDLQDEVLLQKDERTNQEAVMRSSDRQRQEIIDELMEQNQRLTAQLKQASATEIDLHQQIEKQREQVNFKKSTMHSHSHLLDTLQEEVQILTTTKAEMEKRLTSVIEARDTLNCSIEEASDKAHMWERQAREYQTQLRLQDSELKDLRENNQLLAQKIESLQLKFSIGESFQSNNSLMAELECELSMSVASSSVGFKLGEYDEIECDEDFEEDGSTSMEMEMLGRQHVYHDQDIYCGIYSQLLQLLVVLNDNKLEDIEEEDDDVENGAITEHSVIDLIQRIEQQVHSKISCLSKTNPRRQLFEAEFEQMRDELYSTYNQLEILQAEIDRQDKEIRQKSIEIEAVTTKVTSFGDHLSNHHMSHRSSHSVREQVHESQQISQHEAILQELQLKQEDASSSKDFLILQLKEERDKAQARIEKSELEIAQTKEELMNLDCQLLKTIQQKANLSHQLDEWQVDIHELLNKRLQSELKKQEKNKKQQASSIVEPKKGHTSPKKFSLWPGDR